MIVDVERNDLGRICEPGSIAVKSLFEMETYASVIHQTATVEGRLKEGLDAIDCFGAMFPGGSITGAPKIRAMEVIEELETGHRGVYTGSIGYIGFDGRADFNIAIRTMRIANGELSFSVGGGIVWDSDPKSEYEETLHKAKALFDALGVTRNGD
jgi:para-aminobenzoate synthetase component 1